MRDKKINHCQIFVNNLSGEVKKFLEFLYRGDWEKAKNIVSVVKSLYEDFLRKKITGEISEKDFFSALRLIRGFFSEELLSFFPARSCNNNLVDIYYEVQALVNQWYGRDILLSSF